MSELQQYLMEEFENCLELGNSREAALAKAAALLAMNSEQIAHSSIAIELTKIALAAGARELTR